LTIVTSSETRNTLIDATARTFHPRASATVVV
jgi:hypothetical protein